ncbi:seipin-1 [Rutidosis leptorrhynchoides]|uniref:seipin-1 n=1 Tax=Rutidosis leptorrhynchoides TaxID=125765 RepID=UPI003A9A16C9
MTTTNNSTNTTVVLFKKAMLGFVGAAYVCFVLMLVMLVSVLLGVSLVKLWVEEPVYVEENMYFDYTVMNPYAVLDLGFVEYGKVMKSVPVGHVCNVGLLFVMPDSDYNRDIGMFQVVAESLSSKGDVISRASHPIMLHFRSSPIRAIQTFLYSAPFVLGIKSEIQRLNLALLKYKERHYPRTQSIRITLIPRAGIPFLPQIYEAKLIVKSELPWRKALVRNWKWTLYVWTSLYMYIMLLVPLLSCCRSLMFPNSMTRMRTISGYQHLADLVEEHPRVVGVKDRPTSENFKRWRQSRSKRKAMLLGEGFTETSVGSDATSMSVTRDEDTSEVGDSESICHLR